jgi:hypothetical protein
MNIFYICVRCIFRNKTISHLFYNFFRKKYFLFSIFFLMQPINHEFHLAYTNREIESNNSGLHLLNRNILNLIVLMQHA